MNKKKIIIIHSKVSYGFVGLNTTALVLQLNGFEVITIPTVLYSNHLGLATVGGGAVPDDLFQDLLEGVLKLDLLNDVATIVTGYIVIVKSTWDYHIHLSEFLDWLTHLESLGIMVKNNAKTIRWNSDKIYLKEIADSGLPVVSSIFSETFDEVETSFEQLNTQEIVVKPRISAGAKDTFKVKRSEFSQHKNEIEKLMATTPIIVQPFVKEIADGEWSFLFFGGNYSHSLLKTPKEKDFRVQHYWGGSVSTPQISGDIIEKSIQPYVSKFASDTLYARVDGVFIDGIFHLMELELIEPYLFLSTSENSFENYYQALLKVKSAL